jgi:hypothetical protein
MLFAGPLPPRRRRFHFADDAAALASDWKTVGQDMQSALDGFAREHHVEKHATAK